jgi:hypothetical protein
MNVTRIVPTALLVALTLAACARDQARQAPLPPDEATSLLAQRVWLDREPRGPNDRFHILFFDGEQAGVFQDRTVWKGSFEVFLYEAQRGRLDVKLPASRKRLNTGFTVEHVRKGNADVKLTLEKSPAGPTVFYGYRLEGHADADAWVADHFGARAPE